MYFTAIGLFETAAAPSDIFGRTVARKLLGATAVCLERSFSSSDDNSSSTSRNLAESKVDMKRGGLGFGSMTRPSDAGTPAFRIFVSDALRISFALFQSSPVLCETFTR